MDKMVPTSGDEQMRPFNKLTGDRMNGNTVVVRTFLLGTGN